MSNIIGIDLGTTNSLVATVDSGIPLVLADSEGQRLLPSVVHVRGSDQEPWVGTAAQRMRTTEPRSTLYSVKRFMGRRGQEIPDEEMVVTYPIEGSGSGPVTFPVHGHDWTPELISAEILKALTKTASTSLGESITRAVITVPAYFNDAQRNATRKAGELAGLHVERILNEPTAAALAYGLNRLQENARVAVYDLGGGTFDLSILQLQEGTFQVLATSGNTRLGGDDIDRQLIQFLCGKIQEAGGPDPSEKPEWIARVREVAEQAKIRLSSEERTPIQLPFLTPRFSFELVLTRPQLNELARETIERTRTHCMRSLEDAKLKPTDLDEVILVGGQTRMPLVRQFVSDLFQCAEFEEERGGLRVGTEYHRPGGPRLNTSQNPDEAIALGAAIQAEILSGGFQDVLLLDITPLSLGIETFGGLMNVIIPRNSTIPIKAGELFTTAVDHQRNMLIHVLQGERERARDNWSLGRFTLEFESAPRGVPRVGVQFEIDANGILHVLARDTGTGKETVVEMKSAVDVDDSDVQRMVEESVEHAFDDMAARQWVEAELKARETMTATEKGLIDHQSELDEPSRQAIESALKQVREILPEKKAPTTTGDPRQLKSALAELDKATQPLADLMMDRAMETMLRQQGLIS